MQDKPERCLLIKRSEHTADVPHKTTPEDILTYVYNSVQEDIDYITYQTMGLQRHYVPLKHSIVYGI